MESVWTVSKLSTKSVGSRCELVANCVHTADADATQQNNFGKPVCSQSIKDDCLPLSVRVNASEEQCQQLSVELRLVCEYWRLSSHLG